MADDDDIASGRSAGDAAGVGIAMNAAASDETRAYLREQTALARLQKDNLLEQNAFELSHLRFRRFSDWAKFALEISAALIALLVVFGLATMVWNASRARDLVVEPFSVPSDVAGSGMTGSVLAARVLDRLGALQASTNSLSEGAGSLRSDDRDKVRVEIPDTGISIGELNRYLRGWLGDDIAIGGDLVHTPKGLALTIRYGNQPGSTVEGGELGTLIDLAAERLYRAARPLRYADYLAERGRYGEADAILTPLTARGGARARALAWLTMANLHFEDGDVPRELDAATVAARLDPANAAVWYAVDAGAYNLSHRQQALEAEETVLSLIANGRASDLNPDMAATMPFVLGADHAIDKGDPTGALQQCQNAIGIQDCSSTYLAGYAGDAHDVAEMRRYIAMSPVLGADGKPNAELISLRATLASLQGDWAAGVVLDKTADAISAARLNKGWFRMTELWPHMSYGMARAGDTAGAEALIAKTGLDCDDCVVARGQIAAVKRDWAAAERWFALVSRRTPSMPQADTQWGAMLLAKGDLGGAIARFASAHIKGPHFADPLEMWGEALILQNRSDLALAKFAEAARYAPNWGRLHLKWGEALLWSGDKAGARAQFAVAHTLDLAPSETSELASVPHG
ncbi:MAG TPA: hypothetical protein VNU97_12375 [Rhizomicrobium sp.]|jgi:tetratricopeptide (TPR) repeat protein|nr:hypothetical protein [Rhizomicrobium sp.]